MGFFSDLWEGIKSTASNVWSGAKNVAGKVYDVVRSPIDMLAKAGDVVSKIPILGGIAAPLVSGVRGVQSALDQAKGVADIVKSVGLQDGGMVRAPKKYYQA